MSDLTAEILAALITLHGQNLWATELAFDGGVRRCDFWTISANGSAGFDAIAYEIKISRADFRRDSASKQRQARLFSDRFFYVTPLGLVTPEEVPDWAGLIELNSGKLRTRVHAPRRDKDAPTWQLLVSLIRNSGEIRRDSDARTKELIYLRRQIAESKEKLRARGISPWEVGITT